MTLAFFALQYIFLFVHCNIFSVATSDKRNYSPRDLSPWGVILIYAHFLSNWSVVLFQNVAVVTFAEASEWVRPLLRIITLKVGKLCKELTHPRTYECFAKISRPPPYPKYHDHRHIQNIQNITTTTTISMITKITKISLWPPYLRHSDHPGVRFVPPVPADDSVTFWRNLLSVTMTMTFGKWVIFY